MLAMRNRRLRKSLALRVSIAESDSVPPGRLAEAERSSV